jgi:hypothetical protein
MIVAEAMSARLERVQCNCPPYKGSDFWNDPHRWCGVDAPKQRFWMKTGPTSCERTYRPVKAVAVPTWHDPYRNCTAAELQWLYTRQLGLGQNQLSSPFRGQLFGLLSPYYSTFS